MTLDEKIDKLTEQMQSLCIGQERMRGEISGIKAALDPLSTLPKEVIGAVHGMDKNREAIFRVESEQRNARKRSWGLFLATLTAVGGAISVFISRLFDEDSALVIASTETSELGGEIAYPCRPIQYQHAPS